MDEQRKDSKTILKEMTDKYYDDLNKAHERGQLVAWTNGLFPQEFFEAMDLQVAYPENHAAALGAKKGAMPYIDACEGLAYSNDLCSYSRISMGYMESFDSEILNIPKPDIVACCTNVCGVVVKWFESIAAKFNVPFVLIDTPYQAEYGPTENDIDYIVGQFHEFIHQLEVLCKKPFDYEKFHQALVNSREVAKAWGKATKYVEMEPSPFDGFNMFNYMTLAVVARSKKSTADFYNYLADEMEEYAKEHKSQFKGEQKYRVMWEGIACWPHLSYTYKTMKDQGIIIVGGIYPFAWLLEFEQDDIRDLAKAYALRPSVGSVERQAQIRKKVMEDTSCDGALYHLNRSCKLMTFLQAGLKREVFKINGKPYATFDGDQTDPQNFSPAQFDTRVQALVENMKEARAAEEGAK